MDLTGGDPFWTLLDPGALLHLLVQLRGGRSDAEVRFVCRTRVTSARVTSADGVVGRDVLDVTAASDSSFLVLMICF